LNDRPADCQYDKKAIIFDMMIDIAEEEEYKIDEKLHPNNRPFLTQRTANNNVRPICLG
jgi:hypothetical protein